MDRRDFIKSGLFAAAVGAAMGPKAIAQEANRRVEQEQKATLRKKQTDVWSRSRKQKTS